jgi:hypothetical protein
LDSSDYIIYITSFILQSEGEEMKFKILGYTVEIQKAKRGYKNGVTRRKWTSSEINTLVRLRSEEHSWKEIGELMNRTAKSCSARYYIVKG